MRHSADLGALRVGQPPSESEIRLAEFLFGEVPEPGIGFVKPWDVMARGGAVSVTDIGRRAVLRQTAPGDVLKVLPIDPPPGAPVMLAAAGGGGWYVADQATGTVLRLSADGAIVKRLARRNTRMNPTGIVESRGSLWVSDAAAGCVACFDIDTGRIMRTIGGSVGGADRGPGALNMPMGMAAAADGRVFVADMLAGCVVVFDADGAFVRRIGGREGGNGMLGRPKDVAIAPDGVVFVSDAAARQVHAFAPDGGWIESFGDTGPNPLVLPAGLAIADVAPMAGESPPVGFAEDYYVLVVEQIAQPGVRVYGWRSRLPARPQARFAAPLPDTALAVNPHWRGDRCSSCHDGIDRSFAAIPVARADALCLSCHDGRRAGAEPHPIGRVATNETHGVPAGWPLADGRLSCLTCHDVVRHCRAGARRPARNPAMVRGLDRRDAMASCRECHIQDMARFNPHRIAGRAAQPGNADGADGPAGRDASLSIADVSCRACHAPVPRFGGDAPAGPEASPLADAHLREPAAKLCLNCHTPHADPAPNGHLGLSPNAGAVSPGIRLPLEEGRITCATCHDPHDAALYAAHELPSRRAARPSDAAIALRADYEILCTACHPK
jgi:predicted CXXCH cytochrome family protein